MSITPNDTDKETVLQKVQKLLNLAADAEKNGKSPETDTALEMAYKLLRKNGLSLADAVTFQENQHIDETMDLVRDVGAVFKAPKVPEWMNILISAVNEITSTRCLIQEHVLPGQSYGTLTIIFVGEKTEVAVAIELYNYLRKTISKMATRYVKEINGRNKEWRSHAEGLSSAVMSKALKLKKKEWRPGEEINSSSVGDCDIDNFVVDENEEENNEDDINEDDIDEESDEDEEDLEFSAETHQKYELMQISKKEKIDQFIENEKDEEQPLRNSKNLAEDSFDLGIQRGKNISIEYKNLIKEDVTKTVKFRTTE